MSITLTSRSEGQELRQQPPRVFADAIKARGICPLDESQLHGLHGFRGSFDADGVIFHVGGRLSNLYLGQSAESDLVSGSLRNWAEAEGVVPFDEPFDHEAMAATMDALDERRGKPPGTLRSSKLTGVELAADIALSQPVRLFVEAAEPVSRMDTHRFSSTTILHKTDEIELTLYDLRRRRAKDGLDTSALHGEHVGRVEVRVHRGGVPDLFRACADDMGIVRAGLLAEPDFQTEMVRVWSRYARRMHFRRVAHPAESLDKPGDRLKWMAAQYMVITGGLGAAIEGIEADAEAGRLGTDLDEIRARTKSHKRAVSEAYRNPSYTSTSDLDGEFHDAVAAIVAQASL